MTLFFRGFAAQLHNVSKNAFLARDRIETQPKGLVFFYLRFGNRIRSRAHIVLCAPKCMPLAGMHPLRVVSVH